MFKQMKQIPNIYSFYFTLTLIFSVLGFIFIHNGLWGHFWIAVAVFEVMSLALMGYANFIRNPVPYN